MGKLFKYALLLFVVLLSFAGNAEAISKAMPQEELTEAGKNDGYSSLTQSEQIRFQFLNRSGEHLTGSVNNSPVPPSKNNYSEFTYSGEAIEHLLQYNVRFCLLQNKILSLSLTSIDIIFPFHHFW